MNNRALEIIEMDCSDERGLNEVASCLPHMYGLKSLSLCEVGNVAPATGSCSQRSREKHNFGG